MQSVVKDRPRTPQALFTRVAPYYDLVNSMLSFGMDRRWRRKAAAALELAPGARVLDVATGTGALALELARLPAGVSVSGCDLNQQMLALAERRFSRAGLPVQLLRCDANELPFESGSFDAATIAFALDDMPDRHRCITEIRRVLRDGGRLALLELGQPEEGWTRSAYQRYLRLFRLLKFTPADAYNHLEQEILGYRGASAVQELLGRTGFNSYAQESMTWGVVRLHLASKDGSAQAARSAAC